MFGQEKIQRVLKTLIDASEKKSKPLPHILFMGPSGFGKTSFTLELAKRKGVKPLQVNSATLKNSSDVLFLFYNLKENSIVFLDEIHRLDRKAQESLYTAMEGNYINIIDDPNSQDFVHRIPPFTLIGATTSTVPEPMLNRFMHVFEFEVYTDEEIGMIIGEYSRSLGLNLTPEKLIPYSRNNPRRSKNLVGWIHDYCIANGIGNPDSIIEKCMLDKNLFEGGLSKDDIRYLRFLRDQRSACGISTISSSLGIDKDRIVNEIEPFLLSKGMIIRRPRGRMINLNSEAVQRIL